MASGLLLRCVNNLYEHFLVFSGAAATEISRLSLGSGVLVRDECGGDTRGHDGQHGKSKSEI